ncbi:Putative heat shock protein YegD, partial [Salmonella enterica subsp. enterica serovar Alachua str. R6-377]
MSPRRHFAKVTPLLHWHGDFKVFIGFDYGTANCSVAIMRDGHPQLLTMENNSVLLPSMLCAPTRARARSGERVA